jgi:hypothetical protein
MRFQIHQDRAISTPFCPRKIVNANHPWNLHRAGRMAHETAQQGRATGRKLHVCGKTRTRLTASSCCYAAQKLCRRLSPTLITIGKRREIFSERLARTGDVGTAKTVCLDQQNYCLAQTG